MRHHCFLSRNVRDDRPFERHCGQRGPLGRFWLLLQLSLGSLILILLISSPIWAQSPLGRGADTATVVVDGRPLFQVSELANYTAEARADQANNSLNEALQQHEQPWQVEVTSKGELTTLRIAGRHLLTVTERDVMLGVDPMEQAIAWQRQIDQALQQAQLERSPPYQRQALLQSMAMLAAATAIHLGLRRLRQRWRRQQYRSQGTVQPARRLVQLGLLALQTGLWIGVGLYITGLFPQLRSWRYTLLNWVVDSFEEPLFTLNQQDYALLDLLIVVALIIGLWLLVRGFTLLLKSRILNVAGVGRDTQEAIAVLTQYALTFLGLIVILQVVGLDVSSLVILGGALGVGIGFGLQNIINNLISGIIILLERPIGVGDFVNVGDLVGTVERIGSRSTEVRTLDQVTIIVPNAHFLEKEVVNWDHGSPVSRLHLPVGVAYGSEIEMVQQALLTAVKDHPDVLAYPEPQVWFQGFGDSALEFDVLVWCCEPRQQFRLKSDLYYRIEASLRHHGVEIPFPQRDLHVRSPQLEQLIDLLVQQQSPSQPHLYYPNHLRPHRPPEPQPPTPSLSTHSSGPPQSRRKIIIDIERLTEQMRGPGGVVIQDRRYRLNVYPRCFVGTETVDWLMQTQKATREEAIRLGQTLLEQGVIHHVLDEHPFEDEYYFYRFYCDEQGEDGDIAT